MTEIKLLKSKLISSTHVKPVVPIPNSGNSKSRPAQLPKKRKNPPTNPKYLPVAVDLSDPDELPELDGFDDPLDMGDELYGLKVTCSTCKKSFQVDSLTSNRMQQDASKCFLSFTALCP